MDAFINMRIALKTSGAAHEDEQKSGGYVMHFRVVDTLALPVFLRKMPLSDKKSTYRDKIAIPKDSRAGETLARAEQHLSTPLRHLGFCNSAGRNMSLYINFLSSGGTFGEKW
ncbi:MAG: hypothetical protein IJ131_03460 [Eggerthellaceae bacterium]|nr:hypothetical protein [Eggerthellaceae bacterium]